MSNTKLPSWKVLTTFLSLYFSYERETNRKRGRYPQHDLHDMTHPQSVSPDHMGAHVPTARREVPDSNPGPVPSESGCITTVPLTALS